MKNIEPQVIRLSPEYIAAPFAIRLCVDGVPVRGEYELRYNTQEDAEKDMQRIEQNLAPQHYVQPYHEV